MKGKVDVTLQMKVHVYMYMYICMINTYPEQPVIFNETNRAALPITYSTNDGQPAAIYMYNVYRVRYVHLLCPIGEEIRAGGGVELSCSHGDKDGKDVQKIRNTELRYVHDIWVGFASTIRGTLDMTRLVLKPSDGFKPGQVSPG